MQYEALNYDGTERRANYRFVSYRIDILHMLGKKEAAAIIFEILYRWETDVHCKRLLKEIEARKKAGLPPLTEEEVADLMWTYMSYNDFVRESGSALGYNTVIRMLAYLIEMGIIEQRKNHDPRYPDYEYRINKEMVRKLLKELPASPTFAAKVPKKKKSSTQMGIPTDDSTHLGTLAQDSTHLGRGYTHEGTEVYPNGGTSQIHTENTQKKEGTSANVSKTEEDSFIPSSTPSLSHVEHLYTTNVDNPTQDVENKQAVIQVDTHPIATATTPIMPDLPSKSSQKNTEPLTLASLSEEQKRIDGYLKKLRFPFPRIQENFDHLVTIAEYIQNLEDMDSYLKFTRSLFNGGIFLGNLANLNNMNRWLQTQPVPQSDKPAITDPSKLPSISGLRNYVSEPEVLPAIQNPPQGAMKKLPEFKLRRTTPANKVVQ